MKFNQTKYSGDLWQTNLFIDVCPSHEGRIWIILGILSVQLLGLLTQLSRVRLKEVSEAGYPRGKISQREEDET